MRIIKKLIIKLNHLERKVYSFNCKVTKNFQLWLLKMMNKKRRKGDLLKEILNNDLKVYINLKVHLPVSFFTTIKRKMKFLNNIMLLGVPKSLR